MAAWVDGWADGWSDGAEWIRLRTTAAGLAERSSAGWAACLDKVTRTSWFLLWEQGRVELYSVFSWFYFYLVSFVSFSLFCAFVRRSLEARVSNSNKEFSLSIQKLPVAQAVTDALTGFPHCRLVWC